MRYASPLREAIGPVERGIQRQRAVQRGDGVTGGGVARLTRPAVLTTPTLADQVTRLYDLIAQWYELTWGNQVHTRTELHELCAKAGLRVREETAFSRFHIILAEKT